MERATDNAPLPPAWKAAAACVASLLALGPCQSLYQELWVRSAGAGGMALAVFAPIVYGVVLTAGLYPLIWLLGRLQDVRARWLLCLLPAAALLAVNGLPGLIGLGTTIAMVAGVYVEAVRKAADWRDLKTFLQAGAPAEGKPRAAAATVVRHALSNLPRVEPPAPNAPAPVDELLQALNTRISLQPYDKPLWDLLDFDGLLPLSTVSGIEDGFHYTVLDLRHFGFGLQGGDGRTAVTTFFIVAIPDTIRGRVLSWKPRGWDVSADASFVYMARPQQQHRPTEWRHLIQQAIKVVESLQTREQAGGHAGVRSYQPKGSSATVLHINALLFLLVGTVMIGWGVANMVGLLDYRTGCVRGTVSARCLDTRHGYSVAGALIEGGKFVLTGGFLLWGAHSFRDQARKRQRNDVHQQADL